MSSYKWKKLLRHVLLVSLMLTICIVTTACAFQENPDATVYSEPTEVSEEEEVTLYFNVDREEYEGKGVDGFTGREKDPDTGYFQIMFAGKGRVSFRRVAERRVVNKIDNQDVMALVQDENGVVTDIITVDECTGGYYMTGKQMYVSAVNGNVLTLYGNSGMLGSSYTLEYTSDTKIYDVSELAEESETQGAVTTLTENDKILVVYDKDGTVGWIFVTERVRQMETRTRYCDHCQKEVTWYGWNLEDSLPISGEGHYWLTEDVACSGQMSMAQDANIVLDLDGHTVTSKAGKRVYSLHNSGAYLAIMDYSKDGTGKLVAGATTTVANQGACVWVRYGTFELYGGTLDASNVSGNTHGIAVNVTKNNVFRMYGGKIIGGTSVASYDSAKDALSGGMGGALYVDGFFDMFGGEIIGGRAKDCLKNGKLTRGNGGAIYISGSGSMRMSGGLVTGGSAAGVGGNVYVSGKAAFTMGGSACIANGKVTGESKTGGNVYVSKNGIFMMNSGTITGGSATGNGGNVYAAESSTVHMSGGVIRYGTAVTGGGNVYVSGKSVFTLSGSAKIEYGEITGKGKNGGSVYVAKNGTFNMGAGEISGGTSRNAGGNMAVYGTLNMTGGVITGGRTLNYATEEESSVNSKNLFVVNSTMNMSGGQIDGYVGVTSTEGKAFDVTISGTAKIKGEEGKPNLIIPTGKTINVGEMQDGAEVYVSANGVFSTKTDEANTKYFHSDNANMQVCYYDGCLAMGRVQCACGASANGGSHVGDCDGTKYLFTAWTKSTELPTTPGYYYLTKDITLKGQANIKTSGELVLDLDGHTVTSAEGKRAYALWTDCQVTLSIMDTSTAQTGKLIATGAGDAQGRVLWLRAAHTVNLYGGTLDASGASGFYGLGVCAETKGATINMYDGTIIGGDAGTVSGGAVRIGGATFNMYGGTITGGTAKDGGNVYVVSGGKFLMQGGTISGGTATGRAGNIYIGSNSTLTISGEATVANGKSGTEGGNVYVSSNGTVDMTGGAIKDGSAANGGGNVYVLEKGQFTLSGSAEIKNGEITGKGKNGGSVYVKAGGTFNMNGGVISGGTSRNAGGNMVVYGTLNMTDGAITGGKTLAYDTGKESSVSSKNLFVVNGTMNMSGGQIDGYVGVTSTEGKAFDVTISGTAKIKGEEGKPNLIIPTGKTINVGEMQDGAEVYVTASGTFSTATNDTNRVYFHHDNPEITITCNNDGCLEAVGRYQCICGASANGGSHMGDCTGEQHLFTAWTKTAELPTDTGYYYLTKDVVLTGQMMLKKAGELVLDLNGHMVTQTTAGIYSLNAAGVTLTIADSQGTGKMDASGVSEVKGSAICSETNSTINMYGGKIIGGNAEEKSAGAVYIKNTTFNMYGGTIQGGTAKNGGNVYVSTGASLKVTGGTITGGTAKDGGGNVFVDMGTMTVGDGAVISNGNAKNGGNIYLKNQLNMNGGTISGGTATGKGNNVYVEATGKLTMSGGNINGGVYLCATTAGTPTCEISGNATVINEAGNSGITLEKKDNNAPRVAIQEGFAGKIYVDVAGTDINGYKIATASTDAYAGNIVVPDGYFAFFDTDGYKLYDSTKYRAQCICGASLQEDAKHIGVCDGTEHLFTAWTKTAELPTTSGYYYLTKDVQLSKQATVTVAANAANIVLDLNGYQVSRPDDKDGNGLRIYSLNNAGNVTLTIADSQGTGKMVATGSGTNQGRIIWCPSAAVVNLYGGTLDASTASGCRGLGICAEKTGTTINMYGGKIIGGQVNASDGVAVRIAGAIFNMSGGTITGSTGNNGGNVYVGSNATFNMSGGTITSGSAAKGGNVYAESTGKLVVSGGSIDGGVYLCATTAGTPTCEISGNATVINEAGNSGITLEKLNDAAPLVTIQDGFAGEIYVDVAGAEKDGYKIATASTDAYAGNIVVPDGYFVFFDTDGYKLYDSTKYRTQCICGASLQEGAEHIGECKGNLHLFEAWTEAGKLPTTSGYYYLTGNVTLSGQVKIESNETIVLDLNGYEVTRSRGGRILALWSNCEVTLSIADSSAEHSGKLVGSGMDKGQGIVVWLNDKHTLNLYSGTLDASQVAVDSKNNGYGLAICGTGGATINMYGGTIIGGNAGVKSAGAVHISNAIFNMKGGTIREGKAANGGNVYVSKDATFNMTGGTITCGNATEGGGNVFVELSATMTMEKDAVISSGSAKNGGNIYLKNQLTMNGGTITNGTATQKASNLYITENGKLCLNAGTIDENENSIAGNGADNIEYPTAETASDIDVGADEGEDKEATPTESTPSESKPTENDSSESDPSESLPTEQEK